MNAPADHSSDKRGFLSRIGTFDRRLGDMVRRSAESAHVAPIARTAAAALGPGFRLVLASWLVRGPRRRVGVEAIAAAVTAAQLARVLRDAIGRERPGPREEGGMPSRHAAAAVAIAQAARRHGRHGGLISSLAAVGLAGRVASAAHEPLDIIAGASLGHTVERTIAGLSRRIQGGGR